MYDLTLIFPRSPFLINEAVFPPLGIMYLSAYLKRLGLKVQCLDMALVEHRAAMAKASTIGISFTTPQRWEAYALAKRYRKLGKHLIAGGAHATHMPGEARTHRFDIVIRGYGEALLASVFGIKDAREFNWDFLPDRDAFPLREYGYRIDGRLATPIMTSRGCPYDCSFCAKIDDKCHVQNAERTLEEIFSVRAEYGIDAFMIFDDVFIINKPKTREMADALEKENIVFRCFGRANLMDEENCELLKRMGTVEVGLGVESGSDAVLSLNRKGTSRKINTEAVKRLHRFGIRAKAFLIVGLPGETEESLKETMSWIAETKPDDIDVTVFQPLPGSPIFENPKKWGIDFDYDNGQQWYKGRPGEYYTSVRTDRLSSEEIVGWRNLIERKYKKRELLR